MKGILNEFLCDCFSDADILLIKLERSSARSASISSSPGTVCRCWRSQGERERVEASLAEAENSGEQRKGSPVQHYGALAPPWAPVLRS